MVTLDFHHILQFWFSFNLYKSCNCISSLDISTDLLGLSQDNNELIEIIQDKLILKPSSEEYNLSDPKLWIKGQHGQPFEVEKIFKGKKNGFYIEAGAFDGEAFSNTLLFELKHNWTGLLVEPNPDNFKQLLEKKRKAYSLESCFSTEKKVSNVDFDAAGAYGGIINGINKPAETPNTHKEGQARVLGKKARFPYKRRTMKLQCLPLTSIIMAMGNPIIDYLSLDIEGAELSVLKTIDFDKIKINVISFEYTKIGNIFNETQKHMEYFMKQNGYKFYTRVGEDHIYVKEELYKNKDEL